MQTMHPLFVHFPIALILSALALDLLALALKRPAIHRIALWNLSLGALAAGAAVITGRIAEESAKRSFEIERVLERHERLAYVTLILALLISGWRLLKRDQLTPRLRLLTILGMLALAASLGAGAFLGGRMVYEFGVGGSFGAAPP